MKISLYKKYTYLSKKGQTLLEVVVTIGVAMIIIGSLVALVNASTRRANLARQATQASKLAQEGVEIVRNIRDIDDPNAVKVGQRALGNFCSSTPCKFSELYNVHQGTLVTAYLQNSSGSCTASSWCLVGTAELVQLGIFYRSVEISDDPISAGGPICSTYVVGGGAVLTDKQTKRVTVKVTWASPIGSQERSATTCLTKWRQY